MEDTDEKRTQSGTVRPAVALFMFTATLCGLLIAAAKTAPVHQTAPREAAQNITTAANVYAGVQAEHPLLSSQIVALQGQVQTMHEDLGSIHFEFVHLQETLDLIVGEIMGDLKRENEELRDEIHRMYVRLGQSSMDAPSLPPPPAPVQQAETADSTTAMFKEGEFGFIVLDEWGRTPEDAARLGNNVSTLKGMIGLVPPKSGANELQSLGIDLRMQYADYDNINIEVFDNKEAADSFAKRPISNPVHRVLSVSKHANSGRDVILLMQNGMTTEVPF